MGFELTLWQIYWCLVIRPKLLQYVDHVEVARWPPSQLKEGEGAGRATKGENRRSKIARAK